MTLGAAQVVWHRPAEQTWLSAQRFPHAPQLAGSVCALTQVPLQLSCELSHTAAHTPPVHTRPAAQVIPHPPQFARSVRRSTQALPQSD